MYRVFCVDQSTYIPGSAWTQPTKTQWVPAPANPALAVSVTMTELTPGTTYGCSVGSNNTFGGFADIFNAAWPTASTLADHVDTISTV